MSTYQAVLWDMDGTLLDTSSGIYRATDLILDQLGLTYPADFDKASLIGPPMQDAFSKYWYMDTEQALATANLWRDIYRNTVCDATPYPGIMDLLKLLYEQGVKQAVATNKTQGNADRVLAYFGMDYFMDCVKGGSRNGNLKKSDLIGICLNELGINASNAVYIGDTPQDAHSAFANGLSFIGVSYGFGQFIQKDCTFPLVHRSNDLIDMLC